MAQANQINNKQNDDEAETQEIDGSMLAKWMQDNAQKDQRNDKYLIIDVRDYDYGPQKIIGSINIPKHRLISIDDDKDKKVINKLIEQSKMIENVIFHCRYSMVRGPESAKYYLQYRKDNYPKYPKQNVLVLRGGFAFWQQQYPKLCENV